MNNAGLVHRAGFGKGSIDFETRASNGRSLRAEWVWTGDRWCQRIGLLDHGSFCPLITSQERAGDRPCPASPPVQEVHCATQSGRGPVLLAVGRSADGHWSISVQQDFDAIGLRFDVACRCVEPPDRIGSHYRILAPIGTWQAVGGDRLDWHNQGRNGGVAIEPLPRFSATAGLNRADGLVWIEPITGGITDRPQTVRWQYRIILA